MCAPERRTSQLMCVERRHESRVEPFTIARPYTYRRRGAGGEATDRYDLVVNALGHEFDWRRVGDPLPQQLLRAGIVRPHATGFGIDADRATKAVIGHRGIASDRIFAVGHPLRGVSWESNSIPEQVAGATELANSLARIERRTQAVA